MSLSFIQEPVANPDDYIVFSNWSPINGYTLYRSDDNYTDDKYYYKLVLEVKSGIPDNNLIVQGSLRQRPNGYSVDIVNGRARAIFDLRDIVNSTLCDTVIDNNCIGVPFGSIHEVGANTYECSSDAIPCKPIFSKNGDRNGKYQIDQFLLYSKEWYSDDQFKSPSIQVESGNAISWWIKASMPLTTPRGDDPYAFIDERVTRTYMPIPVALGGVGDSKFLSDVSEDGVHSFKPGLTLEGHINKVKVDDYHTVAFINRGNYFNCMLEWIRVEYFEADGTPLNSGNLVNTNTGTTLFGGSDPATQTQDTLQDEMLLYFGCGPANLQAQSIDTTLRPFAVNNRTWAFYTIQGMSDYTDARVTDKYYFVRQWDDCKEFLTVRLGWVNSKGAYDYFNFVKKSEITTDITRTHYESMLGTYDKSVFRYNDTDRGKNVNKVTALKKQKIQTDWLTEVEALMIESLLVSTNVFTIKNIKAGVGTEFTQPVVVTDKSFKKKTLINDGIKIKYTINIEFANLTNTNS